MADGNEGFTVTWKIKNFLYCMQKNLEPLKSPSFVVNSFGGTWWNLLLYPKGVDDEKDVGLYLQRQNPKDGPEHISLDYELSIINANSVPTACVDVKDHSFEDDHGFGAAKFISRKDILEKDMDVLPNDILTIRCRMWYCGIEPSPKECTINTCIGVDKGTFKWIIKNFSSLRINEERTLSLESSSMDYPSLLLKFSLTGGHLQDRHVKIEVNQTDAKRPSYVVLNVQVLSVYGKALEFAENEHFFEKKDGLQVWTLPPFITKEKLLGKRNLYLPQNELTLKCDCVLSVGVESEEIEYDEVESVSISDQSSFHWPKATQRRRRFQNAQMTFPERLDCPEVSQGFRSDIQRLYQDQILSDFTLRVGTKAFPVHKAILSARSEVFERMFTNDMLEHTGNFVEVPDLDSETMHRFLLYIYTENIEQDLHWSAALKLYFAADKYQVLPLRQECSACLRSSLCPSNAYEILELADMHQDNDLKSCVQEFILMNDHLIIGSDEWKKFERISPDLAYETIREIYLMKISTEKHSS